MTLYFPYKPILSGHKNTQTIRSAKYTVTFFIVLLSVYQLSAQSNDFKLMFYNLENYFDPFDDPATNDNEFTPAGSYHWTQQRFIHKRNSIYKTIVAVNEDKIPDVIGLCELENRYVLQQLTEETPLSYYGYGIVHHDSPDERGIDVALLYRKEKFRILQRKFYRMDNHSIRFRSREILYVEGITCNNDTLHLFVNHWPSKRGSAESSEPRRMAAAISLRTVVDSIFSIHPQAAICIMGDFNDYADSDPIIKGLQAITNWDHPSNNNIYSLALPLAQQGEGTLKYQNRWELIDQIFVSGSLLDNNAPLHCTPTDMVIFKHQFLLESTSGAGFTPKRTYKGMRYNGGVSDHLPIGLTLTGRLDQ